MEQQILFSVLLERLLKYCEIKKYSNKLTQIK